MRLWDPGGILFGARPVARRSERLSVSSSAGHRETVWDARQRGSAGRHKARDASSCRCCPYVLKNEMESLEIEW